MNYLNLFKATVYSAIALAAVLGLAFAIQAYPFYSLIATLGMIVLLMIFFVYTELNDS
jgi:asparagine N-glycosylation enzyme membrane subunit Stt3